MKVAQEFKAFILRGNVVDLAVGIVIGAAFTAVVNGLVTDILTPLISIPSKTNFTAYWFNIGGGTFQVGLFLNAVVTFILVAAALFFFVVKPVNELSARRHRGEASPDPTERDCPYCLSSIPIKATRCKYCTAEVPAVVESTAHVTA
jgi:large conductance mechanosensitive channel